MGSTKIKTKPTEELTNADNQVNAAEETQSLKPRKVRVRSKQYVNLRSQVDKTKNYELNTAIALVKKLSRKNHPTLTADINTKEVGVNIELTLPHSNGKQTKIAIANDDVIAQIDAGKIDFDMLLAKPDMMGKLAKYAKVLGPKGLMPNPKNKTVVADPQARKQELEANSVIQVKTEKKFPIVHLQVGLITQPDEEIAANLTALVKRLDISKITKLTLSSTMSPGVKVDLASLRQE